MYQRETENYYTSDCTKSTKFEQYHSDTNLNDHSTSNIRNEDDDDFDHQLEKWGCKRF